MPVYHVDQTYDWNYENGPDFNQAFPERTHKTPVSLLGCPLNSPVGITAGILLNAKWVSLYAKLGYDILTYKTVRSDLRECYPLPNWVFIEADVPLDETVDAPLVASRAPSQPVERLTSSVCFGMPSKPPEVWRQDVAEAKASLAPGQMLNVSVVGTPKEGCGSQQLARDYAQWAFESGADVVEANLSCPNVDTAEGQIYHNRDSTIQIVETIREAIPNKANLLVKIGLLPGLQAYEQFLQWTQPFVQGISLVNCIQRPIQNPDGAPAFGQAHPRAGVLGWATFEPCLRHLQTIVQARQNTGGHHAILACGGVTDPENALAFRQAGADAVMMGGAPAFNPFLGLQIQERLSQAMRNKST